MALQNENPSEPRVKVSGIMYPSLSEKLQEVDIKERAETLRHYAAVGLLYEQSIFNNNTASLEASIKALTAELIKSNKSTANNTSDTSDPSSTNQRFKEQLQNSENLIKRSEMLENSKNTSEPLPSIQVNSNEKSAENTSNELTIPKASAEPLRPTQTENQNKLIDKPITDFQFNHNAKPSNEEGQQPKASTGTFETNSNFIASDSKLVQKPAITAPTQLPNNNVTRELMIENNPSIKTDSFSSTPAKPVQNSVMPAQHGNTANEMMRNLTTNPTRASTMAPGLPSTQPVPQQTQASPNTGINRPADVEKTIKTTEYESHPTAPQKPDGSENSI